ncbi:uncharacterized protein MONOS_8731 [Monocercomonoides exilis]|uniref:uncharacterized protein n=1 Tax=Monocercomonoides exilis TaxID=2049356 RepID=UPI003559566F|nr:hypothetical protein MONOS_8731 [Monocercomonoides exilis]|eukprot:MONOS_8731.1-p1 / transcript=MONOS_8731.1 / gene=MONOS_8731 / organism=Monocercomonoides_exilis_PA203 / gene_product=unspecified product / transcript_product=unspecified product / location=Mono_scaffold00336:48575-56704(-) / protein_length=2647 / sequence_SO=supercontig / SO=protein_coding / is_pseudo=false
MLSGVGMPVYSVFFLCVNLVATTGDSSWIGEKIEKEEMIKVDRNMLQINKNPSNDGLNNYEEDGGKLIDEMKRSENEGRDFHHDEEKSKEEYGREIGISKKADICQFSEIEGCLECFNSSVMEMGLILREKGTKRILIAKKGSIVSMKECILIVGKHSPPIELEGSFGSFLNISIQQNVEAPDSCSSPTTTSTQTTCMMNSCSFLSVCDAYDGGIVPSLNNPSASLTVSNTSFVGCSRTRNVECIGSESDKRHPERQNETTDGANSFIWCEWNGSKTTGKIDSWEDGVSSGGAINVFSSENGELFVSHCVFNGCVAYSRGGGIMCYSIRSFLIENSLFNECHAERHHGGGLYASYISLNTRISGCKFQNCNAFDYGGGLLLQLFQVSGTECIGAENWGGESTCLFDCSFSSCSVTHIYGGGIYCRHAPEQFKMRNIQFISCSAEREGGGLRIFPNQAARPSDGYYCCFLFFHECKCFINPSDGHDVMYYDRHNLFLSSGNPFYECYTTNTNEQRVCYGYWTSDWEYQNIEKKEWLKKGILNRFVSVRGGNSEEFCGANESYTCQTTGVAVIRSTTQTILMVTLMEGNHTSETTTIEIGEKKISVNGKGRTESSIGTGALSPTLALFSVTTGHLGLLHMKVDCNSNASPSPSVVFVSDGSGSLSLEDVVITTSNIGEYMISSSVFVVPLSQLSMVGVEIKDMNASEPLFTEPVLSSSSLSSSALFLTATASGESILANLSVKNVRLIEGDGVVAAKSVAEGETFVVQNVTIEDCESKNGSGGGIKVDLLSPTSKLQIDSATIKRCTSWKYGGGMMLYLADNSIDFSIVSVDFSGCSASLGGNYVFVNGSNSASWGISSSTLNVQHDESKYNELVGYDRSDTTMRLFPLNVYLDRYSDAAHVGKGKDGLGGYDSWFCGFDYYPCATITHAAQVRYPDTNKKIELDSGYELAEAVGMTDSFEWEISCATKGMEVGVKAPENFESSCLIEVLSKCSMRNITFCIPSALSGASSSSLISSNSTLLTLTDCSVVCSSENSIGYCFVNAIGGKVKVEGLVITETLRFGEHSVIEFGEGVESVVFCGCEVNNIEKSSGDGGWVSGVVGAEGDEEKNGMIVIESCVVKGCRCVGGRGGGMSVLVKREGSVVVNGSCVIDGCEAKGSEGSEGRGGGMMISVRKGGSLEMKNVKYSGCEVPREGVEEGGRGMGGGMFVKLADEMGSFVMEGMEFEGCDAWKGKNVFVSGWDLSEIANEEHLKWEIKEEELGSLDELCGWERKSTGEEGYVIPLVVYLWRNWSGDGFVSKEKGGDFSGCGYSEAPCSSIDHLISLRYPTLGEGETHISIVGSGLLSHSISFSSSISESPKVVIEGTKKGTGVTISDEDENDLSDDGSMISSNVSLSFVNVSFTKPAITTHHSVLIESSGANTLLSVSDCSFGPGRGVAESFGYCVMRVNGGSVVIERCSLSLISELKGLIAFSPSAHEVTLQNVNISFVDVTERSLISMMEEENQMNGEKKVFSNGNRPVLRVVGCSFSNITNEGIGASVIDVGSFEDGVECVVDECSMSSCKSGLSIEGGGMRVVLKSGESVLKVNGSSFSMCKCSSETGCGGGLFIDGSDPHANYGNESQIPPLNFKIVNILFVMNEAHVGKDIFVRCHSIAHQINETLFALNYNQESLNSNNSIYGRDVLSEGDVDLIPLITFYYSAQVFVNGRGSDGRGCGAQNSPCVSIDCGVGHIEEGVMNAILIDGEGFVRKECVIGDLVVNSLKKTQGIVRLNSKIEKSAEKDCVMEFVNECSVERCSFQLEDGFESAHNYLMKVKNGMTKIQECEFFSSSTTVELMKLNCSIVSVESGELKIFDSTFRDIYSTKTILSFHEESNVTIVETRISNINCEGDVVSVGGKAKVEMKEMKVENVTLLLKGCVIGMEEAEQEVSVLNSSFGRCVNSVDKGSMMQIRNSKDVRIEACVFDGEKEIEVINEENNRKEGLCKWNWSLVGVEKSKVEMRETTIMKSKGGGLWVSGGNVKIEKGEFENNNPSIEGYPSARRNVICEGDGELDVVSVKGGDGLKDNSSLWILDEGCELGGIATERGSSFFIPILEEVKNVSQPNGDAELMIAGKLFLPCDLSVKMSMKNGDEEEIVRKGIEEEGFVSENEIHSVISCSEWEKVREETEVSVWIVFGKADSPSSTERLIVKNRSESVGKGDERIVEGGKEVKSSWAVFCLIFVVLFLIVLIGFILFVVRWRKQKRRTKELEEIVNDTVRKDPKEFEMVTMEMSPEEQWRRAEKEAEKKNEERMKKRVYETNMQHSESSEHLLSECGSTEYILGRDSDKIPQWMLEKVDEEEEEEETRKRTPSPSISSSSTTDSDSTFVRSESLCPTTSSMSNLVDAMACSSPHEKLIVDLRDSLFMLLHGRNEKKEMAIGTLQEREQTAAQILFWVANLALHSFDEMENPLQSLSSLSPHIVLFSEHMVICIVMHSDLLSSDDSDSSSISSSTVVTSASDDDSDSLPSSAFEDDEYNRKECLRWKAPELLMNKKMGATKESVVFSIGMMLWECLTLEIPFGEYEGEVAGQKIVNGERPDIAAISGSSFSEVWKQSVGMEASNRPSLVWLKREFFKHFPKDAVIMTVSDAIDDEGDDEPGSAVEDTSVTWISY